MIIKTPFQKIFPLFLCGKEFNAEGVEAKD